LGRNLIAEDGKIEVGNKLIWASNHVRRQLDISPSSLHAFLEIANALRPAHPNIRILFDRGIRRGTDIFNALALGADLCFIGQPTLWGFPSRRSGIGFINS
jgi:(S)-2-hydroxy-acid oxidase